jgi:hypothetical protein
LINNEIDKVDWKEFYTAYGVAENVSTQLKTLSSSNRDHAIAAAFELWCSLCHQHAYISSAALPSYPILFKVLCTSDDKLAVEILDIFWGFAKCSSVDFFGSPQEQSWVVELRNLMKKNLSHFEKLAMSSDESIQDFAGWISEELKKSN